MTLVQLLLWPLSLPYSAGARIRAWGYKRGLLKQRHLSGIVVSVGNLTAGGTGKTPMVCWLAKQAAAENKSVGILTRGYRGSSGSSDEADLLQERLGDTVAIGIGANRFIKGKELELRGVEWFILDDRFQHLQLVRELDIVLIDATNPFGGGHLLPAGRLREPVSALRRASVVVITRSDRAPTIESVVRRYSAAPIYYAQTKLERISMVADPGTQFTVDPKSVDWLARKFFVFSGIGNSGAFLSDLNRWDITVVAHKTFRDHHVYSQQQMYEIERRARKAGADALLCTEKDVFNLKRVRANEFPVAYCVISLVPNDADTLWREIVSRASAWRREHAT